MLGCDWERRDSGRGQGRARENRGYELAECTTPISKTGGCYVITPSGQTLTLHRRQRTQWQRGRTSAGGEPEVLTTAAVRTNPEVQGLPVVTQDPGDQQAREAASSTNRRVWPMLELQSEQQENRGDRELLRETDGDTLEVSTDAAAVKARGFPVMPPLAGRHRHNLVHLPFRNWCAFFVIGRRREESHKKRQQREIMTPGVWLDYTFLRLAEDVLVVLTPREEESSGWGSRGHRERTRGSARQDHD